MYLDAFLEAFRVSDVTTIFFFYLEVGLLLLELWCATNWGGAFGVELCCWDEAPGLNWYGALGVDRLCMAAWYGVNGVAEAVLVVYKQEIH